MARKRKAQVEQEESSTSSSKRKTRGQKDGFDSYPLSKVYRLIEPGPVLLVTTGSLEDSTHNVMTIGFHMVLQHEPALIGISLGPWDASFVALKRQRECVLAVPSVEMADVVVDVGNCSAADEDETSKWVRFGLDALPAESVKAPLVGGSHVIANIECVVEDMKMVRKYSMWVLKPIKAWINPDKIPGAEEGGKMFHHRGDGTFVVDGDILNLQDRMVKWQEFQG
ncbi:putative flavin reductase [Phaeomoniella chlamydospora]|uniref:Putative flavin reductase n=1 Tax=Phaeomoniella chlamydospora TaxID=158046 RepID=A0A0G2EUB0_PHACM|nr:putative flavin reductase [Phaeomoniella chlamydospora]